MSGAGDGTDRDLDCLLDRRQVAVPEEAVVPEGAVMSGGKQAAAELEAQFPGWHVWPSSAGRWWATRTGTVLDRDDLGAGRVMTIDADDTQTLQAQLSRQFRLDQAARQ
jgi:hypothetical protein